MQDQFAHLMIGNLGTFLDLGSAHPVVGNNSYALENVGWIGIAFEEIASLANAMNQYRNTPCFAVDVAVAEPFISILHRQHPSKHFNYISLDVDDASVPCLKLLIDNGYTFDVMTFEHDTYLDGPEARKIPSKKILLDAGYKLLFENVQTCNRNFSSGGPTCRPKCDHPIDQVWEWEDWWIGPAMFDNLIYSGSSMPHQECIARLRDRK